MAFNGAVFILAFLHVHIYWVETEDMTDIFRETCPYTSYCTIGPRLNFTASNTIAPCCTQCFCDEDCWKFQDCCPDMPHTNIDLDHQTSCISSVINSPAVVDSPDDLGTYPSYRMFNSCPYDFTGSEEVVRKCTENYIQEEPELDDLVIVSNSRYHDEIYKNKHCAACHGVSDVLSWDLFTSDCPGVLAGDLSIEDVRWYMWHNCTLFSKPPAHLTFNRLFFDCGATMTSDCTHNDKWGFEASPTIKTMCETGHYAPVYVTMLRRAFLYKNLYCALCFLDPTDISDVCSAEVWSISRTTGFKSLTMLLDVHLSAQSDVNADPRCANDETFDSVMKHCRPLNCPWNSHMRLGECATFSRWVTNVEVRIKVLFRPMNTYSYLGKEITEHDRNETFHFVADILRTFKLGPCRLDLLRTFAYLEGSSQTLKFVLVDLRIALTDTCTFTYVLKNQNHNAPLTFHKDIHINSLAHPMDGNIYFAKDYDFYSQLDPTVFTPKSLYYYNNEFEKGYVLEDFFICPYFYLNVTEYNFIVSHCNLSRPFTKPTTLKPTDRVHSSFYVLSDNTIAVCKDTYFRLCGVKSMVTKHEVPIPVYFFFLFLAFSLFQLVIV